MAWVPKFRFTFFKEIIDGFYNIISKHNKVILSDKIMDGYINIIFGANNIYKNYTIPTNSIIVNLEQLAESSVWVKEIYMNILRSYEIWDYSLDNINWLNKKGITNVKHFVIGESKIFEFKEYDMVDKNIDVLFYGALNTRREKILSELCEKGINVKHIYCWGEEREKIIARSKIILNMHYFETAILEVLRVIPLIANNHFVISESSVYPDGNNEWKDNIVMVDYNKIVDTIIYYLENPQYITDKVKISKDFYEKLKFTLPSF